VCPVKENNYYGYKKHLCTDEAEGMITAVVTTAANESDMRHLIINRHQNY
jgi:IS5 family transposase